MHFLFIISLQQLLSEQKIAFSPFPRGYIHFKMFIVQKRDNFESKNCIKMPLCAHFVGFNYSKTYNWLLKVLKSDH